MKSSHSPDIILNHELHYHMESETTKLSIRKKILCDKTGKLVYQSLHFQNTLYELSTIQKTGQKIIVDIDTLQIRTKQQKNDKEESTVRITSPELMESPTASTSTSSETPDLDEKLRMLLPEVLDGEFSVC